METRVKAVVGSSIMVNILDVVPGDILYIRGDESDPVVREVAKNEEGLVQFRYVKGRPPTIFRNASGKEVTLPAIEQTLWMSPEPDRFGDGNCCIHDLKRERDFFVKNEET